MNATQREKNISIILPQIEPTTEADHEICMTVNEACNTEIYECQGEKLPPKTRLINFTY